EADGDACPVRQAARRGLEAPQGARGGRARRSRGAGPRPPHPLPRRAATDGFAVGARVRAVLDPASGSPGAALQEREREEEVMTTTTKTMELTLTRLIPASPAEVFEAWMDPKHPGNPWTDAKKLIFDGRVDGLFYFLHLADGRRAAHDAPLALVAPEPWAHYGRFIAIDRDKRIQYAWMSPFTGGLESVVTVTFEKKGED